MSFWPLQAMKLEPEMVPGTSKWISSTLKDSTKMVLDLSSLLSRETTNATEEIAQFVSLAIHNQIDVSSEPLSDHESENDTSKKNHYPVEDPVSKTDLGKKHRSTSALVADMNSLPPSRYLDEKPNYEETLDLSPIDRGNENSPRSYATAPTGTIQFDKEELQRLQKDGIHHAKEMPEHSTELGKNEENEIPEAHTTHESDRKEYEELDVSLHKIRMSIRRKTENETRKNDKIPISDGSSHLNESIRSQKTPVHKTPVQKTPSQKTPVAQIPLKTPLPRKTPVSELPLHTPNFVPLPKREPLNIESSAPKISRNPSTTLKRDTESNSRLKAADASPMSRNRFPSFIEDNSKRSPVPMTRPSPRYSLHINPDIEPGEPTKNLLPALIPKTSSYKLPGITPKAATPSPIRPGMGFNLKASKSEHEGLPTFMSPTGSSTAKVKLPKSRNKFMTTTLDPRKRLSRHVPRIKSPVKSLRKPNNIEPKTSLDVSKIPVLSKSLGKSNSSVTPKQDPTIGSKQLNNNLLHKSTLSRPTSRKEPEPSTSTNYKRRRLAGNAIALPDAARGIIVRRDVKVKSTDATPNNGVDPKLALETPKLPHIGDDDVQTVLEPWAQLPMLEQLVLKSKKLDPKDIFGDVPPVDLDTIFDKHN